LMSPPFAFDELANEYASCSTSYSGMESRS
jgi:hypothetical protein